MHRGPATPAQGTEADEPNNIPGPAENTLRLHVRKNLGEKQKVLTRYYSYENISFVFSTGKKMWNTSYPPSLMNLRLWPKCTTYSKNYPTQNLN